MTGWSLVFSARSQMRVGFAAGVDDSAWAAVCPQLGVSAGRTRNKHPYVNRTRNLPLD